MTLQWHKSSYSKDWNQALCVEIAHTPDDNWLLRDSKNPNGHVIQLPSASWSQLMQWMRSE